MPRISLGRPSFETIRNNTALKLSKQHVQALEGFETIRNNTALKLFAHTCFLNHCFETIRNNTALKQRLRVG